MKRILKILAIIVVLILVGTYIIYALEYQGNYNVTAKVNLAVDMYGTPTLSGFSSSTNPTSPVQFWDLFKGHSIADNESAYLLYYTLSLTSSTIQGVAIGKTYQGVVGSGAIEYGSSHTTEVNIFNVESGLYTLSLTVKDSHGATVLTHTYEVEVGE